MKNELEVNILRFREANKEDLTSVAELLATSFLDYPLFSIIEEDRERRYQFIYELQYINAKLFMAKHKCFVVIDEQNLMGVALLKDLQDVRGEFISYIRLGFYRLLRKGLLFKTLRYLKLMRNVEEPVASSQSKGWYLDMLAISSKAQGLGLGSEILDCVIVPYIKKNGGGTLFLATNTELNRKFYQKNGFDEYKEADLTIDGRSVKDWSYRKKVHA